MPTENATLIHNTLSFLSHWSRIALSHQQDATNVADAGKREKQACPPLTEEEQMEFGEGMAEYFGILFPLQRSTDSLVDGEWLRVAQLKNAAKQEQKLFDSYVLQLQYKARERKFDSLEEVFELGRLIDTHNPTRLEKEADAMRDELSRRNVPEAVSAKTRDLIPQVLSEMFKWAGNSGKIGLGTPYEAFLKSLEK